MSPVVESSYKYAAHLTFTHMHGKKGGVNPFPDIKLPPLNPNVDAAVPEFSKKEATGYKQAWGGLPDPGKNVKRRR